MKHSSRSGFSLIEVLVATALLVMIVLMLSQVFHASTTAWDSGLTRTQGAMTIRAVVGAIERDLRNAVNATNFPGCGITDPMKVSNSKLEFVAFLGEATSDEAEPHFVEITGGTKVTRTVSPLEFSAGSGRWSKKGGTSSELLDDSEYSVKFIANDASKTNLPLSVEIRVEYTSAQDLGTVAARSAGRDCTWNTRDDIIAR